MNHAKWSIDLINRSRLKQSAVSVDKKSKQIPLEKLIKADERQLDSTLKRRELIFTTRSSGSKRKSRSRLQKLLSERNFPIHQQA